MSKGQLGTVMRPRGRLVCGPRNRKEKDGFGKTYCLEIEGGGIVDMKKQGNACGRGWVKGRGGANVSKRGLGKYLRRSVKEWMAPALQNKLVEKKVDNTRSLQAPYPRLSLPRQPDYPRPPFVQPRTSCSRRQAREKYRISE